MPITELTFSTYHRQQQQQLNRYLFGFLKEKEAEETLNLLYYPLKRNQDRYQASLCLLVADLFSGNKERALRYASLIELTRAAVLVHDEVVDDDHVRDGMSSLWRFVKKKVGSSGKVNPKNLAILLGDSLLAKSLALIEEPEALQEFSQFLSEMTEGAVGEHKRPLLEPASEKENYLDQIRLKRGSLFALATRLGYLTGEQSREADKMSQLLLELGQELGVIQQLGNHLALNHKTPFDRQQQEKLIVNRTQSFVHKLKQLPNNRYRQLIKQLPFFLINQLLDKEGKDFQLELK